MEYAIIGLLVVIVILQIIQLTKKQNNNEINEKLSRTEINVIKEISDFKHNFASDVNNDFNNLNLGNIMGNMNRFLLDIP